MWEQAGPSWTYTLSAAAGLLGVVLLALFGQRAARSIR
jgi:hypothetical protein